MPQSRKQIAIDFLQAAASGNAHAALATHAAPGFCHHNPFFAGDGESLAAAMDQNAMENPDKILTVQRAIQEGEFVVVHSGVQHQPGDLGAAVVHIFRFEGSKIAELWDVGQETPENSPNRNGMF